MVKRVYVEKREGLRVEAESLKNELRDFLGVTALTGLRIVNRYDAENISDGDFARAVTNVFSEPPVDEVYDDLPAADARFAVEFLPGQFDQRADSAAQCVQILCGGERPSIRSARVFLLYGALSAGDVAAIEKYVINPVEARLASFDLPETLQTAFDTPETVETLAGFRTLEGEAIPAFIRGYGLAMDADDVAFCRDYFRKEGRDPTITELRMIDTYWSDHCRHTTFLTEIDGVAFEDALLEQAWRRYLDTRKKLGRENKSICLMDIATLAAKALKKEGKLQKLDESEEINACTVKIDVEVDGKKEPWLLLFKNETHNHPTEIEPFGGAATCIGGAIRDPLSGRSYVYAAMRVTGAADPTRPVSETIPGKLPQKKLVAAAAAGYSSYGNQIGLATGIVDEVYHPGYAAKRLEIGAVIAAAPEKNVRREVPAPGDRVILLGGATGRDGIGGATGSSKAHTAQSVETCGAEVQKGNAPEERKLQRLFRKAEVSRLIKRCNDFGAGGVSVAVGELADGLFIDLDRVPKKYEGLDGTELAISESQERMAVVVDPRDVPAFLAAAAEENLCATVVAQVTDLPRLKMVWKGNTVVDVSREFLNSNGAPKHVSVAPEKLRFPADAPAPASFGEGMRSLAADLNICSKRGLSERFDSTIGAGTVLLPFGGKYQQTPVGAMVHKISVEKGHTDDVSVMAWGFDPYLSEKSPFHGAYLAVVESVSKLIAAGASFEDVYLTLQEYFEKPGRDPKRWGQPLAAVLGAFTAQLELGVAAIGGKDSMSGSFEDLDVPPTLVSFAVTTAKTGEIVSNEFKSPGSAVWLLSPDFDENGLPVTKSLLSLFSRATALMRGGRVRSASALGKGGVAESVMKSAFGNGLGFAFDPAVGLETLFKKTYGALLVETQSPLENAEKIGVVTEAPVFTFGDEKLDLNEMQKVYEDRLESVYPCNIPMPEGEVRTLSAPAKPVRASKVKLSRPRVLIPAFPGTNCEYDSAKAFADAGAEPTVFVVKNRSASDIRESVETFVRLLRQTNIVFLPGGFSGGDEPEGSAKFIAAFFRNPAISEEVRKLLRERDGLMAGICNGFQALIKLGLVPFGEICYLTSNSPTLTFNTIGRHQSRVVRTRIASVNSPWLMKRKVGDIVSVPISHGEGRFVCPPDLLRTLEENGQIATQYVDLDGRATMDVRFNPNGSVLAVEGLLSPDGRVFGKMGHSERAGKDLYLNAPGDYDMRMFAGAVEYYQ